ncbi:phosphotransferase family protein [Microbulbifer magnicolonia]|uniref:phosphotransferase family protein n=1 Tax=Microbulbifer magnicolonia TaxID=3109744 RepID=UPI002B40BED7|nr:phosphotransferase [Microbulbifer sp. GG15]
MAQEVPDFVREGLRNMRLLRDGERIQATSLTGGVSSDIWRVDLLGAGDTRSYCIKRALARLRVADEWQAPVERGYYEILWLKEAFAIRPQNILEIVGEDRFTGSFAMEYLPAEDYASWKQLLAAGRVGVDIARAVASAIVNIHAQTAGDPRIARKFATDDMFMSLRPAPYFLTAARRNPALAPVLQALVERLMQTKLALVHGDLSPKNILVGPRGPFIVDAETAWYGDPAFDLAFCLNHLLLKCLWRPASRDEFLDAFTVFRDSYVEIVCWEPVHGLERRAVSLLYAMMLARVDGKSPVEYLSGAADQNLLRGFASEGLLQPEATLAAVRDRWRRTLAA